MGEDTQVFWPQRAEWQSQSGTKLVISLNSLTQKMTDSASDDERYQEFAELSQYVTALFLYPVVSLVGMVGSVMCIAVLSQRQMLTSTNAYLIALAVADLMKLANDFLYFPATLLQTIGSRRGDLIFAHLYPYAFFLSQYTSGCAAWLTVVVAGERWLMVTHPNWSRYSLTVRKSRIVSAVTYLVTLVVTGPYLLRYETVCEEVTDNLTLTAAGNTSYPLDLSPNCTWRPRPSRLWSEGAFANYAKIYIKSQSCLKSLIPLLVLILLNVRIVMAVRETRANKKLASRNRVTVMLVMVILCYIVFSIPDSALSAMGWGYTDVTSNLRRGVREISDLLLAVNSSVNFFLYLAFNRVFRQNLIVMCCREGRAGLRSGILVDEQKYSRAPVSRAPAKQAGLDEQQHDCEVCPVNACASVHRHRRMDATQSNRLLTPAFCQQSVSMCLSAATSAVVTGHDDLPHQQQFDESHHPPKDQNPTLKSGLQTVTNGSGGVAARDECQRPFVLTVTLVHAAGGDQSDREDDDDVDDEGCASDMAK